MQNGPPAESWDARELLQRYAQHGSADAFAQIVGRYAGLVHAIARRRVSGDATLAEDVVQSVFLLLSRRANHIPRTTALPGWLAQATRYIAANEMRKARRRARYERAAANERSENVHDAESIELAWPVLDEALERLGPKERDAVLLRFFDEMSVQQIAAQLGIEPRAAAKRLDRGVRKLRAFFVDRKLGFSEVGLGAALGSDALRHAPKPMIDAVLSKVAAGSGAAVVGSSAALASWSAAKVAASIGAFVLLIATFVGASMIQRGDRGAAPAPRPASAGKAQAIQISDITFEPVGNGKNVLRVTANNPSAEDRRLAVIVMARSGDGRNEWRGQRDLGFRQFKDGQYIMKDPGPNLRAGQSATVRCAFQIPEPFGPRARITVECYEQGPKTYEKPFLAKSFVVGDLPQRTTRWEELPAATDDQARGARELIDEAQTRLRLGLYGRAHTLFTYDWQFVENAPTREWFRRRMYAKEPSDVQTWAAREFGTLKPRDVSVNGEALVVTATQDDGRTRPIELRREDGQWKIDWIHAPMPVAAPSTRGTGR